ncbi:NRAMP family divalent metal transporter [Moraxella ovis]|uniref:NRAMP family divalent metal transporter n=1 Tax=Moraxella ovis TaxID=29433 RepID=UPI000D8250AF|nr:NRAMP family divalent metal transporter [Moraxella ovis]SPX85699.1 manganese transport protein MntH [Moraxella ovis]STZ05499.1 manganese transport protein MntH [Moraxella ovis]
MKNTIQKSAILGAAFLMATSAVGPGFLTQTATFTEKLGASFGFVILVSILMDIGVQLNVWRVIAISKMKAQEIANLVLPGMGYVLAGLIIMGGLAFNIGNIGGAGLGVQSVFGIDPVIGALVSGVIAVGIFLSKEVGSLVDKFAQLMGFVLIALIIYVVFNTDPPFGEAVVRTVAPEKIDAMAIVTLVGGTVGGYITFSGAHRLLDAGITGKENLSAVSKSSINGILAASVIRVFLFLACLGVVSSGVAMMTDNPALTPFVHGLGDTGRVIFGVVIWAASITSVIGCAYTSVSFLTNFHAGIAKHSRYFIIGFIAASTLIFATIGRPAQVLVLVGTLNGLVLPIALVVILLAAYKKNIIGDYKHPVWMAVFGWIVAVAMSILSMITIFKYLAG